MQQFGLQIACLALKRLQPSQFLRQKPHFVTSLISYSNGNQLEKLGSLRNKKESTKLHINSKALEESLWRGQRIATSSRDNTNIRVSWSDASNSYYPYVWLRDNCTCSECYNSSSSSRRFLLADLDTDIKPASVNVKKNCLKITWPDGHKSVYSSEWLAVRSFNEDEIERRLKYLSPGRVQHWGRELQDKLPKFDFQKLMGCDETLYQWIATLETIGLAIIYNTPCQEGQLKRIGNRVEFLRNSHYGEIFTVMAKHDASNLAYTSLSLGMHSDLTYYYYTPGVQMLHCIKQVPTEGGQNQFADSFHAANLLKERHPEVYETLKTVLLDFRDIGHDATSFFKLSRQPVIQCDLAGKVNKICLNDFSRDSFLNLPLDDVPKVYKALKILNEILYDHDNHIEYKLQPGDIACFHNYRVLHGRQGYKILKDGDRHLEGGYVDWDEMNSRRRVLMLQLGLIQKDH